MSAKLGDMLLDAKLLNENQLRTALDTQRQLGGKLSVILVKLRMLSEEKLAQFYGQQLNLPVLALRDLVVSPKVSALMDVEILEKHQILPIRKLEDELLVAVADPLDYDALDETRFLTGLCAKVALATRSDIQKSINFYFHGLPCTELTSADAVVRSGEHAAVSGGRAGVRVPPTQVLQALVDLLIDKKIIQREELTNKVSRAE